MLSNDEPMNTCSDFGLICHLPKCKCHRLHNVPIKDDMCVLTSFKDPIKSLEIGHLNHALE